MKRISCILGMLLFISMTSEAQIDLSKKIPGIKYEKKYHFDNQIEMEIDFYTKKGSLQMTIPYTSHFTDDYQYINIKHQRGNTVYQTIFDMPNNNCLIILGEGKQVMGSAAVMKDNEGRKLTELPMTKSDETKKILGQTCTLYTFDAPEFSGEMWVTTQVPLLNDVGILKASKMGKYYQKIQAKGFVMEITSVTPNGKKTVMRTTSLKQAKNYDVSIPDDFGAAINKIDYYEY
jgi:hypothetical protein